MLAALFGALAIGLSLGLLGSGGSILTVPVLHYLLGQPEQQAIAGSLLVVGLIAAAALVPYARAGQVDGRNVLRFGLPGMAGAWAGASAAHFVPGVLQLAGFIVAMLAAAWRMASVAPVEAGTPRTRTLAVVAGGFGVGALSGLVGVGGGFLIVPALVVLARVSLAQAVGTSLAVIVLNSITGFAKYLGVLEARGLTLDWGALLLVAAIGIVGSQLGHRLGRRLPQAIVRRTFAVVLLAVAVAMSIDLARRLA
jgi:uncharacterized membrane protein YfcA